MITPDRTKTVGYVIGRSHSVLLADSDVLFVYSSYLCGYMFSSKLFIASISSQALKYTIILRQESSSKAWALILIV